MDGKMKSPLFDDALLKQMGALRARIIQSAAADDFTFLDWQRNKGNTGWCCTIYVKDAPEFCLGCFEMKAYIIAFYAMKKYQKALA